MNTATPWVLALLFTGLVACEDAGSESDGPGSDAGEDGSDDTDGDDDDDGDDDAVGTGDDDADGTDDDGAQGGDSAVDDDDPNGEGGDGPVTSGGAPSNGGSGGDGPSGEAGQSPEANGGTPGGAGAGSGGSGGAGGSVTPGACGVIDTFEDGLEPSRELFVDANAGDDGDGSAEAPFSTLDAALSEATPGTAIRLLPGMHAGGTYAGGLSGSVDAPIWIGGVPGEERPVISGGDNAFQLSGVSFVVVHDLEVTGQEANGINVDDGETASGASHDLIFRDLLIRDIGSGGNQDCLKLSGIDRFHVLDSEFIGCSAGSAVDHVGCHEGIVARNTFSDLGGNGVQSKGGSDDILITQNRFLDAGERAVNMGGSTGFEFFRPSLSSGETNFEARNIRVVANFFRGGVSPIAFVGCVDCIAANNTLVDPEHWVVRVLQETTSADGYTFAPASDGRFVNNLIYYALGNLSTHVNVGPDTAADTFIFSNNLWYAYDAPENSAPAYLPVEETDSVYGEDPGLQSEDAPSIDTSSPAAGVGLVLLEVLSDVNGDCYETPPAVGAYEAE